MKLAPESIEKIADEVADCLAAAMQDLRTTVRLRVAAVAYGSRPRFMFQDDNGSHQRPVKMYREGGLAACHVEREHQQRRHPSPPHGHEDRRTASKMSVLSQFHSDDQTAAAESCVMGNQSHSGAAASSCDPGGLPHPRNSVSGGLASCSRVRSPSPKGAADVATQKPMNEAVRNALRSPPGGSPRSSLSSSSSAGDARGRGRVFPPACSTTTGGGSRTPPVKLSTRLASPEDKQLADDAQAHGARSHDEAHAESTPGASQGGFGHQGKVSEATTCPSPSSAVELADGAAISPAALLSLQLPVRAAELPRQEDSQREGNKDPVDPTSSEGCAAPMPPCAQDPNCLPPLLPPPPLGSPPPCVMSAVQEVGKLPSPTPSISPTQVTESMMPSLLLPPADSDTQDKKGRADTKGSSGSGQNADTLQGLQVAIGLRRLISSDSGNSKGSRPMVGTRTSMSSGSARKRDVFPWKEGAGCRLSNHDLDFQPNTMRHIEDGLTENLLAEGHLITAASRASRHSLLSDSCGTLVLSSASERLGPPRRLGSMRDSKSRRGSMRDSKSSGVPKSSTSSRLECPSTARSSGRSATRLSSLTPVNIMRMILPSTYGDDHVPLSGLQESRNMELVDSITGSEKALYPPEGDEEDSDGDGSPMCKIPSQNIAPFWLNATGIAGQDTYEFESEEGSSEQSGWKARRTQAARHAARVCNRWCGRVRLVILAVLVMGVAIMWITNTSIEYYNTLHKQDFEIPLHKFSDATLSIGSVVGLALTPRIRRAGLLGVQGSLLQQYAEMRGFASAWQRSSARHGCFAMIVWGFNVTSHIVCISQTWASPQRSTDFASVGGTMGLAVVNFLCVALVLCLLHVADAMVLMVERFCFLFMAEPDIPQSIREWNRLQAIIRRASNMMTPCFIVLHTTVVLALLFTVGEVMMGGPDDFWPWLSTILRTSALLCFVSSLTFRAAEVSSRCARVPSLVNSLNFGLDIDEGRTYLVQYLHHSDVGFLIFEAKLTAFTALKFLYLSILSTVSIVTKVVAGA